MENPVYKLEKVVKSRNEDPQDFEGPLDLILFLLSKNKMEIQDIHIALICDQFTAWIAARQSMDLEVASEFVSMASQLVFIKTRMLLSIEDEEAKSEMDALIQSLEEKRRNEQYAVVKEAAARLAPLGEFGRNIVTRPPEPVKRGKVYEYSQKASDLTRALSEMQSRSKRTLPPPRTAFREIVRHEPYPVEEKAKEILTALRDRGVTRFLRLFFGNRSRSEIVATFLAVLELIRSHMLWLTGGNEDCSLNPEEEQSA
ncbi:MAG: segregation/condensation protein A [Oscillibacter sp.]|nr:segregation/condensation protein A [Oscillibacter sp.]